MHVGRRIGALRLSAFHYTFAVMHIPVGIALDTFGPRRTVVTLSWLALAGSLLGALRPEPADPGRRAGAGRGRLCAGVDGLDGVHLPPLADAPLCRHFRHRPGGRRRRPAGHEHAAGLGGRDLVVARGLPDARRGLGLGHRGGVARARTGCAAQIGELAARRRAGFRGLAHRVRRAAGSGADVARARELWRHDYDFADCGSCRCWSRGTACR